MDSQGRKKWNLQRNVKRRRRVIAKEPQKTESSCSQLDETVWHWKVHSFPRAVWKYIWVTSNAKSVSSHHPGDEKSKVRVLARLVPSAVVRGNRSVLSPGSGWFLAVFAIHG